MKDARTPRERAVDTMARAAAEDDFGPEYWNEMNEASKQAYLKSADVQLNALTLLLPSLGLALVAMKATQAMKNAAWMHVTTGLELGWDSTMSELLAAAIAAAPSPLGEG